MNIISVILLWFYASKTCWPNELVPYSGSTALVKSFTITLIKFDLLHCWFMMCIFTKFGSTQWGMWWAFFKVCKLKHTVEYEMCIFQKFVFQTQCGVYGEHFTKFVSINIEHTVGYMACILTKFVNTQWGMWWIFYKVCKHKHTVGYMACIFTKFESTQWGIWCAFSHSL